MELLVLPPRNMPPITPDIIIIIIVMLFKLLDLTSGTGMSRSPRKGLERVPGVEGSANPLISSGC